MKAPRLRRLRNLAHEGAEVVEHAVEHEVREVRAYVGAVTDTVIEKIRTVG